MKWPRQSEDPEVLSGTLNYFLKNEFIYFWLCWVFADVQAFLWLWRVGGTLVAMRGLLTVVASPVLERGLQELRLQ